MSIAKKRGNLGEKFARDYFCSRGYRFRSANYHSRWGEIDLLVQKGNTLVFVEVKYRRSTRYGRAIESLGPRQQIRLMKTAQDYLLKHPHAGPCRFDLLAVQEKDGKLVPQHISNVLEMNATY